MRKPVVAANWKMFKTRDEALQFIYAVNDAVPSKDIIETIICAPAIHLRSLVKRQGENIRIGAQICIMLMREHIRERYLLICLFQLV